MRIIILLLILMLLGSCNNNSPKVDLKEGKLIYSISGAGTTSSWKLEILFNQENVVVNEKYARGAGRKYIYDKKSGEILGLIDDAASLGINKDSYFIYYKPEELVNVSLSENYGDTSIFITEEFKDILGYKCQKLIIKHGEQATEEVWLTDQIKPGMIYPRTPLLFDKVALEYEMKILGKVSRKYVIKSISKGRIDKSEFEQIVPDLYYLVIPMNVFSVDTIGTNNYKENTFTSFTYPYYKDGRESTIKFLKTELYKIVPKQSQTVINFFVNKDGKISDIAVEVFSAIYRFDNNMVIDLIKGMKDWVPAKVKGKPVKSKVTILG